MMPRVAAFLLSIICPLLLHAQGTLYITSGSGNQSTLYTVDPTNGLITSTIGPVKVGLDAVTITGLAFHPTTGVLYGVTGSEYFPERQLVSINLVTGAATSLGTIGTTRFENANDITFATNGALFGWTVKGGPLVSLTTPSPGNVTRTVIPSASNGTTANGLTFTPDGTLYLAGPTVSGNLYTVNPITGALTNIAPLSNVPLNFGVINAMASDASGLLYATGNSSSHSLVTINRFTGVMNSVGTLPFESDALAFQSIPEPSTYVVVFGLVVLAVVVWQRREAGRRAEEKS